eukprot:NODE_1613_length_1112_cov_89.577611_g1315_i0.p1 GENE.NODE_1613_length_1112_cov_89.577611_g1315_i0~~NODE_1613_length_1112_cov_89.577611_g1315_i0.p1  ORF type:complete len:351 (-),score=-7.24 NODE_1613_length_1112_cov_89.577611_g1315_i0:58-1080(-)
MKIKNKNTPWVEKYRPKTVDDVVEQTEVVNTLKKSLDKMSLPHLLFYGPPGNGKTTTILAICKQLFGPQFFSKRVLELNASDDRGIDVIRNKVKTFAQIAVSTTVDPAYKYPLPPFKIIILDECDSMTRDAQAALRRIMEKYSKVTRFCLICNYVSRIISPLTSRCAKFRFKQLGYKHVLNRLEYICKNESLNVAGETLDKIIDISNGDLRMAITYLQSASLMYGNEFNLDNILEIANVIPFHFVENFYKACWSNNFKPVQKATSDVIYAGYSVKKFLSQLLEYLVDCSVKKGDEFYLDDLMLSKICLVISKTEKFLIDGADEYMQLLKVASHIMKCISK